MNNYWYRVLRPASIALDAAIATAAFLLAYALVFDFEYLAYVPGLWEKTASFVAITSLSLFAFGVHRASWRYVALPDMINLIKAGALAVTVYTVGAFLVSRGSNVPRSVVVLSAMLLVSGLVAPRILYRAIVEGHGLPRRSRKSAGEKVPYVLILGLTASAESFIRNWRRDAAAKFEIAGILDSAPSAKSQIVQGVKVLGAFDALANIVQTLAARGVDVVEVVVAETSPSRRRLREIVQQATAAGLKVSRVPAPSATSALDRTGAVQPRAIELNDLLGRDEVTFDIHAVKAFVEQKTVLITGAGGSIGSELARQIASFEPRQLILTDHSEHNIYTLDNEIGADHPDLNYCVRLLSVRDRARIHELMVKFQPDIIFHAAALKHVPLVEMNPLEGIKTNLMGTINMARAAVTACTGTFVLISTDKAVRPTSIMGMTKRAAEAFCQMMDRAGSQTRFRTVRFGNVLGSNGSVVPRFREQIDAGGPLTVTHPRMTRYFMTIPEAVRLVLNASAIADASHADRGSIMVLDMGEPVRIIDLAERMIELAGYRPGVDVEIEFVGLRPGEKLYEELFDDDEMLTVAGGDGYLLACPKALDPEILKRQFALMEQAVIDENENAALQLLHDVIPNKSSTHPSQEIQASMR